MRIKQFIFYLMLMLPCSAFTAVVLDVSGGEFVCNVADMTRGQVVVGAVETGNFTVGGEKSFAVKTYRNGCYITVFPRVVFDARIVRRHLCIGTDIARCKDRESGG